MDIIDELGREIRFRASTNQDALVSLLLRAGNEIERLREEIHFRVGRNAPDTSKAVSTKIREGTLQAEMMLLFTTAPSGLTDDQMEQVLERTHQSVSACRNTLMRKGYIEDSGQRRKTRSGNDAIVWRLK